jgi:hypothetical protein
MIPLGRILLYFVKKDHPTSRFSARPCEERANIGWQTVITAPDQRTYDLESSARGRVVFTGGFGARIGYERADRDECCE